MGNCAHMTAKSRKIGTLIACLCLVGIAIAFPKIGIAETLSANKPLSAIEFWSSNVSGNVIDNTSPDNYIFCGDNICNKETQKCVSRSFTQADTLTYITNDGQKVGAGTAIIGTALVIFGSIAAPATLGTSLSLTAVGSTMLGAGTLMGGASWAVQQAAGTGTVTSIIYKCIDINSSLGREWKEEEDGGIITVKTNKNAGWVWAAEKTEKKCAKASDKRNTYCLVQTKGKEDTAASVFYGNEGTAFEKCEVLPVKLYNNRQCFFCGLFSIMYAVSNNITTTSFNALAKGFAAIIALGLAIWIAIQVLNQISSLTKQDAPKFITLLIKQSYKFVIAFLLLQYSYQAFQWIVLPIIDSGIKLGATFIKDENTILDTPSEENNPGIFERAVKAAPPKQNSYYPNSLYMSLDNFVASCQQALYFIQSIGSSLICIGSNALTFQGGTLKFGDGLIISIEGIILAGYGFLLSISFAFYLIDAIVQFGIAGALMPFLIASWPFKLTSKYTSTGFNMILNSAFIFMFAGLIISVNVSLISAVINSTAAENSLMQSTANNISNETYGAQINLEAMANAINSQSEDDVKKLTDISSIGFISLILCCYFGFMFMNKISELSGKFASGASKAISPQIATMAASAMKSGALKFTQHTREAAGEKISYVTQKIASGLAYPIIHPQKTARNIKSFFTKNKNGSSLNSNNTASQGFNNNTFGQNQNSQSNQNSASANKHSAKLPNRQERKELARKAREAGLRKQAQTSNANKPKDSSQKKRLRKRKNKHHR